MLKAALWIVGLGGLAWITFGVRLGPQSLAGHLHDLWLAKEGQALRQGVSDEVHGLFGGKAKPVAPLDPVADADRAQLSHLVSQKAKPAHP